MAETDDDDKTEAPSQKRLDDARAKGDVPRSIEVNSWFVLSGLTLIVGFYNSTFSKGFSLSRFFSEAASYSANQSTMLPILWEVLSTLGEYLLVPFTIATAAALIGPLAQHFPTPSLDHAMPKLSRVSPFEGIKRVMGSGALAQFVKNLAKLIIVGTVVSMSLWGERNHLGELSDMDASALLEFARNALIRILIAVVSIYALVAGGDYFFQWLSWQKRLRMSRQDLKDEYKQQEGSPEIKNKLRQMRRKLSRSAMMGNLPKATVIVTNPTHFAVALKFDEGMRAPVCVAKGVDVLALRIRQLANEHDIPIVEDRPLARSLYRLVEVDEEIPLDLYKPVAEIIGYVMRLRMRRRRPVYEK